MQSLLKMLLGMMTSAMVMVVVESTYQPKPDIGVPAGLIPECPGVMKNVTISNKMMPKLQLVLHRIDKNNMPYRKTLPIMAAPKMLARDKNVDFKTKKTVIYACGYLDSSLMPPTQAIAMSLAGKGYNVLVTDTFAFLSNIYPLSARIARTIGKKIGELLVKLHAQGLEPENLELVGISLGAHILSYAAKHFIQETGKKPSRLTGLDPAGPCFRALPASERLNPTDAERVDVLHTNIDGFGMADPMGHVDFYANGGEYQPSDIPAIPCLVICSHIRALLYYWQATVHPKKFIGVQCDSVQDARLARCYDSKVTNKLGPETYFDRTGIFYLPTNNEFPYYRGKDGLKSDNEIYTSFVKELNRQDNLIV